MTRPMDSLLQLAERVERAEGPDPALGREVLLACGWRKTQVGRFMGPLYQWSSPDGRISFDDDDFQRRRHDPTASLDAAMKLASANPNDILREAMAALSKRFDLHMRRWPEGENYAEWLARFVTAAALRARALTQETAHAE